MDFKLYLAILSYLASNPRQAPVLLRQFYFDRRTRFHQYRISECQNYRRSSDEALAFAVNADKDTLGSLPSVGSLDDFWREIQSLAACDTHCIPSEWDANLTIAHMAYRICRLTEPRVVVETGVAHGITSAFILQALAENGWGHLYSIDLPAFKRGSKDFIGIAALKRLRDRWTLTLGLSGQVLPRLLPKLGEIDMFLHDSDHSYHNQLIEYSLAWKYLAPGGVLLSDDINSSDAFIEFAERCKVTPVSVAQPTKELLIGLLVKP